MLNLLGTNVSTFDRAALNKKIDDFLAAGQHYLVTINPEIILASHHDEEYFYVLNKSDLAPADGFGLVLAGLLAGVKIPRITGADLVPELLAKVERENLPVSILNWHAGLSSASDLQKMLMAKWPKLRFQIVDTEKTIHLPEEILASLNNFAPRLLLCSFGAPFQEKVIYHNIQKIPSLNLAIGIGGALDFLTKKAIRAPKIFQRLGLEWFWRLLRQPKRIKRIWRATAVFFWEVILWRFVRPHVYRPNVSCMLVRRGEGGWEVLIVERQEPRGHWQLPQGGTDGEPIIKAGLRELREETKVKEVKVRGVLKNAYKYRFQKGDYRGIVNKTEKHYDYRGQKQSFLIAEMLNPQEEVGLNFWDHAAYRFVPLENLAQEVHPARREMTEKFVAFAKKVLI